MRANKITGANAGGPRQLPNRTLWAARIAQFRRWAAGAMKLTILKPLRWFVLLAFGLIWAASYLAAVGLDHLQAHLQAHEPLRTPPSMFGGTFDGLILFLLIPLMIIGAAGTALSALWCLGRLIADLFKRGRSKQAA